MIDHFGLLAPVYDRLIGPPDPARWQELLRLPTPGRLLDVGGGTGRVSYQLRPLVDEAIVTDLSSQMLSQGNKKNHLWPVQAYSEKLPFPAESFERIMVVDAMHHFQDQRQVVRELLRVLKPGGRLVIEEPDIDRLAVKLIALAEKVALMGSRFYSAAQLADMVSASGWPARIQKDDRFAAWVIVDK